MFGKLPGLFLFAVVLLPASGWAGTFKMPEDKPVVSITIPASWKPEGIDRGVQGQAPDDNVYIAAETTRTEKDMNAIIDESFAMLKEHKVDLKKDSKKETKFEINGLQADELLFEGKDEEGPTIVSVTFITIGKESVLVLTYWASPDGEKNHGKEVKAIVSSIKELK